MNHDFTNLLDAFVKEIREKETQQESPVNQEFSSQEEAFTYYRRLLSLCPGEAVTYKTNKGDKRGVFVKFTHEGRPFVWVWDDGKAYGAALSPYCLIFDDENFDVDDDDIEEFNRT